MASRALREAAENLGAAVYERKTAIRGALEEHIAVCEAVGSPTDRTRKALADLDEHIPPFTEALRADRQGPVTYVRDEAEIRAHLAHLEWTHKQLGERNADEKRAISGQYELLRWVLGEIPTPPAVL